MSEYRNCGEYIADVLAVCENIPYCMESKAFFDFGVWGNEEVEEG